MSTRLAPIALGISLLSVAACSDHHLGSEPPPPPPEHTMGQFKVTVEGKQMSVEAIAPENAVSSTIPGIISPAIYGGPNTVKVSGTVDSIVAVAGVSNTWYINILM